MKNKPPVEKITQMKNKALAYYGKLGCMQIYVYKQKQWKSVPYAKLTDQMMV